MFLQNIHARWGGAWYNESVPHSVFAAMAGIYQHFIFKNIHKGIHMNILLFLTPKNDVAYLFDDFTMRQALEKMEHHRYSAIPVITRDGSYSGTITEGDLLWAAKNRSDLDLKQAENLPISEIPRLTRYQPVRIDVTMEDLVGKALNQNFVPVVDDRGVFIGIVKRKEIISYFYQKYRELEKTAAGPSDPARKEDA